MKHLFVVLGWLLSWPLFAQVQLGADIDGEAAGDFSGQSVAMSADGQTVAVGAISNDGNGSNSGHVRVYRLINGSWSQLGVDLDGEAAGNTTGRSVALSADGNTVAIGAPLNDGNGNSSGQVRVYRFGGGSWSQLGADINGEAAEDFLGYSVALSADGNTVAIGAPQNDGNGTDSGQVRVYRFLTGSWSQLGADIDGEAAEDISGRSVALSADGNTVAIGAPDNDGNGNSSGQVRVYRFSGGSWSQLGADIDGEAAEDISGNSVALSADGNTVAIGAPFNAGNGNLSGQVRVYRFSGGSWSQLGADLDGEAAGDNTGRSVALSADGNTVAIGAQSNDGNGNSSGQVRVYRFLTGSWSQLGADIDGEAAGDLSGYSVAVSADGNTVAIGAPNNNGNGNLSGQVRVYRFCDPAQAQVLSLQASGTLGAPTCQVRLQGQAVGTSFVFTGPGGYVFSNVYRQAGNYLVFAEGIRQPGVYQLRASRVNECLQSIETTITVSGTACP